MHPSCKDLKCLNCLGNQKLDIMNPVFHSVFVRRLFKATSRSKSEGGKQTLRLNTSQLALTRASVLGIPVLLRVHGILSISRQLH